jgi:hypothetical protein
MASDDARGTCAPGVAGGRKDDAEKPRMSLLPFEALVEVACVMTYGARKYSEGGWRHVPRGLERYTDALLRHLAAWQGGEAVDPESGLRHVSHMACNAVFIVALELASARPSLPEALG